MELTNSETTESKSQLPACSGLFKSARGLDEVDGPTATQDKFSAQPTVEAMATDEASMVLSADFGINTRQKRRSVMKN